MEDNEDLVNSATEKLREFFEVIHSNESHH